MPLGAAMPVLHLIEYADSVSHFADAPVALPARAAHADLRHRGATGLLRMVLPSGWCGAKHPSPWRQVALCLSGRLHIQADNGEVREFLAGAISRMKDMTCSGHTTTVLGEEDVRRATVELPIRASDVTVPLTEEDVA